MRKFIFYSVLSLISLTFFTLFLEYFSFINVKPDIILLLVVYLAISSDETVDIFIAFTLGFFFDIFSGSVVGLFAMLRTVTFVVTRFLNMNFFSKNTLFFVVITFVISMIDSFYLGHQYKNNGYGSLVIIKDALYISSINALMALALYKVFTKIEEFYLKTIKEQEGMI
ncbi:rod shape-determining protein MreD [Thermodesulfobacteriota bacterium]